MTIEKAQKAYAALPLKGQARFLAILGHELTIWARESYPQLVDNHEIVVSRLRAFNEFQHKVTGQLIPLLEEDPNRYPDDVFVSILFEMAQLAGCETKLARELADLHAAFLRVAVAGNGEDGQTAETAAVPR